MSVRGSRAQFPHVYFLSADKRLDLLMAIHNFNAMTILDTEPSIFKKFGGKSTVCSFKIGHQAMTGNPSLMLQSLQLAVDSESNSSLSALISVIEYCLNIRCRMLQSLQLSVERGADSSLSAQSSGIVSKFVVKCCSPCNWRWSDELKAHCLF